MRNRRTAIRNLHAAAALIAVAYAAAGCDRDPLDAPAVADGLADVRVTQNYRYTEIQVPGAIVTQAFRMNARGDLVGAYRDAGGVHGFVRRGGDYQQIDFPGAIGTQVRGINARGHMVGSYNEAGRMHGFTLRDGVMAALDVPDAWQTIAWDINANGVISGEYQGVPGGPWFGFVYRNGDFQLFDVPDATMSAGWGINLRGEIVGHYRVPDGAGGISKMFGFVWRDGSVIRLDHPVPNGMSCAMGIGDNGAVVGHYYDLASGIVHGYVWLDGDFRATLTVPGVSETYPTSITPSGVIAGYTWDPVAGVRGFIAEPLNPAGK